MIVLYLFLTYIKPAYRKRALSQYKQNIYNLILEKNISSFSNYETSSYISALTNDVNYIEENYIFSIFDLIRNITLFIASVVIMILYSPLLTLVAIGLSLLPLVCSLLVGNKLAKCEEDISNNNASFMHYIKDNLIGFSTIKVFKAEEKMKLLFSKNNDRLESSKAKKIFLWMPRPFSRNWMILLYLRISFRSVRQMRISDQFYVYIPVIKTALTLCYNIRSI